MTVPIPATVPVQFRARPAPGSVAPVDGPLVDRYGRVHDDLRISVTDRCNLRCIYCMPEEGVTFLPRAELLTFDEIVRVAAGGHGPRGPIAPAHRWRATCPPGGRRPCPPDRPTWASTTWP